MVLLAHGQTDEEAGRHTRLSRQEDGLDRPARRIGHGVEGVSPVTPEGTRKPNSEWKRGFYYIALKAKLPILLYGVDYKEKKIECTKTIVPNGDVEGQMAEIKDYFKRFVAKKPENFAT